MRASALLPTPLRPTRPVCRPSNCSLSSENRKLPSGSCHETPFSVSEIGFVMQPPAKACGFVCDERRSRPTVNRYGALLTHGTNTFTGERSEEHTSELQSLMRISYAVFCLNKKQQK